MSVDDGVVLRVLDDLEDLLLDALDVRARPTDGDGVGVGSIGLALASADADADEPVLADESVEDGTSGADDGAVVLRWDVERGRLDVGRVLGELEELVLDEGELGLDLGIAGLLLGRLGRRVDEDDVGRLKRLDGEDYLDAVLRVELVNPTDEARKRSSGVCEAKY